MSTILWCFQLLSGEWCVEHTEGRSVLIPHTSADDMSSIQLQAVKGRNFECYSFDSFPSAPLECVLRDVCSACDITPCSNAGEFVTVMPTVDGRCLMCLEGMRGCAGQYRMRCATAVLILEELCMCTHVFSTAEEPFSSRLRTSSSRRRHPITSPTGGQSMLRQSRTPCHPPENNNKKASPTENTQGLYLRSITRSVLLQRCVGWL